jgi:predicted nucleic acid-binding protein
MSGSTEFFVDTNLLLYGIDLSEPRKRVAARTWIDALWRTSSAALSWQVIHEFYANALRKLRLPENEARELAVDYLRWHPLAMDRDLVERAWHWQDQSQISYWDGLIVAAAERLECSWLLSEDFQTGRKFGKLTVVNPFLKHPQEFKQWSSQN